MDAIIPADTRYVPIPQQPYCCGPASLTMVMIRHGIPPLPQELLGYHMGLIVPSSQRDAFWNPRHAEKPVVSSGFGTQIQNEKEFGLKKVLAELNIPLSFDYIGADQLPTREVFQETALSIIQKDGDVLACLNWGALCGQTEKNWGHIMCIDKIDSRSIRFIDTDAGAKWKIFPTEDVFRAIKTHGNANYGGLWVFRKSAPRSRLKI